jgi:hypothetical protein
MSNNKPFSNNSTNPALDEEVEDPYPWRQWIFGDAHADTHNFVETAMQRAPKEIFCAASASLLVSPLVSIIDKCIVQDVSGSAKFMQAIGAASKEMFVQPRQFFGGLSFTMTALVYFGTYATANLSELALDVKRIRDDDERKTIKVGASAVANIGLLAWRDSVFARAFSANTPKHATPMRTIGLFAVRDAATMYATFYAAPRAAEHLQEHYGVEQYTSELSMALAIPVFTQIVTAPFHIHAMDYYAKPEGTFAERMATIKGEFKTVAFARGLRILPAFGIGSFSNNRFRDLVIRHEGEDMTRLARRVTQVIEGRKLTKRNP